MSYFAHIETELHIPKRPEWRRAWRAIQIMRNDPERTDQVYEISVALDGGDTERQFQGFLAEPGGPDLLQEAPELIATLADFEHLETLHPNSLGRAYLAMMRGNGYGADGMQKAASKIDEFAELHPGAARSWFAERAGCVHDLHHVITGYGQDPAGETALLAFTVGLFGRRFRFRAMRFGLLGSLTIAPRASLPRTLAFAWQARRRGARARIPFSFRWEEALERPLADVCAELGVATVEVAHPRGMLRGTMDSPWLLQPLASR